MNRSPPLSYESLKSVLGQIDANIRFRLFSRIPSIRPTDKVVPLRIRKFLSFNNKFIINNTKYEVGIYKKYPPGMTPPKVQEINNAGGLIIDLDQHGFVDKSGNNVLTPGDVDLRDESMTVLAGEPYQQRYLEKKLEKTRRKIEFVESFGPISEVLEDDMDHDDFELRKLVQEFLERTVKATSERPPEFEGARKMAHNKLSGKIKNIMAKLQPFYSRRDGVPVPYESFIQLTVSSRRREYIERVRYSKKLHESAKYLSTRLFGNRRHPIHIKLLTIWWKGICWNGIMRLPVGLRLKIKEIDRGMNIHFLQRSLAPLLDAPLKELNTVVNNDEDFECSILKEARCLEIIENHPYQMRPQVVLNLQNLNFHKLSEFDNNWYVEDFLLIIKNWVESGKKVGSCYSFGINRHVKNTILGQITEAFKNAETGDASISIPTRFNNQVKVSIEEHQLWNQWVVKFEVLPVKRASQ